MSTAGLRLQASCQLICLPCTHSCSLGHAEPRSMQVVFMLGELDCRDHLASLQEPRLLPQVAQRVHDLLSIALGLIRARGFRIALHPVIPALAGSLRAVQAFNDRLTSQARLTGCPAAGSGFRVLG